MADRDLNREERLRQIVDFLQGIQDSWILWQIHRFIVNIAK